MRPSRDVQDGTVCQGFLLKHAPDELYSGLFVNYTPNSLRYAPQGHRWGERGSETENS